MADYERPKLKIIKDVIAENLPAPGPADDSKTLCKECGYEPTWETSYYRPDAFPARFKGYCHSCAFWFDVLEKFHEARRGQPWIVVQNSSIPEDDYRSNLDLYKLGNPYQVFEKYTRFLGHGGRAFICVWQNGTQLISNNVWHKGTIPRRFKHPARFGVTTNMALFRSC